MSADTPSATRPLRHAAVVPSQVVALLRAPLRTSLGVVELLELLAWPRASEVPEYLRREMLDDILKRLRHRAQALWALPTGVRLTEGWQAAVSASDRSKLEQLLRTSAPRELPSLTVRELKTALAAPLVRVLELLARLEALYWAPGPTGARTRLFAPAAEPMAMTPPIRAELARAIALPWSATVHATDMRFGFPGAGTLREWLAQWLDAPRAPADALRLARRVVQADTFTVAEEAQALAHAVSEAQRPRAGATATERWARILLARHLSPQGPGRTLEDVGAQFGVTRERVRQVCSLMERTLAEAASATPALDRLLAALARTVPCSPEEANEQFARFLGEGAGTESLVDWARMLGRTDLPVQLVHTRVHVRGAFVSVKMFEAAQAVNWVAAALRHASRDCSQVGCTNIVRVAGLLALEEAAAPGAAALETALAATAGFRWLNAQSRWFTLGSTDECAAANRLRKLLAVATEPVSTDQAAAAFATDDLWLYRESPGLGLATPPVHVLRELFAGWTWLRVVQKNRFVPATALSVEAQLSRSERLALAVIEAHDGVACRFEVVEAVKAQESDSPMAATVMLGASPIIEKLEHGLYKLRGRRVGHAAIDAARLRLRARMTPGTPMLETGPPAAHSNGFVLQVTAAALRNEQYTVPRIYRHRLTARTVPVSDAQGRFQGWARVSASGTLRGVNRLFPDLKAGERLRIDLTAEGLQVHRLPRSSPVAVGLREADAVSDECSGLSRVPPPAS
jgi:hypothetical protein